MNSKLLTPYQQNFTRLVIVSVDLIKLVLADILRSQIKPAHLYNAISSCPALLSGRQKLRPEQERLCYLPAPNIPDYSKFDASLLYSLIRNLCPTLEPTLGWGKTPSNIAIKIGDDIERFRVFRNEVHGHCESSNVNNAEFTSRWKDVETAIKRIQAFIYSKGFLSNYEEEIKKIKNLELGSEDMEKYKLLLEAMILIKKSENEGVPKISIYGVDIVTCGGLACFEVAIDVESSPVPIPWSVMWQRVRGNSTEQLNISAEKYKDSNYKQLVIQNVSKEDEGEYQAVLSRNNLKLTSNSIFLVAAGHKPNLHTLNISTGVDGIILHCGYTVTDISPNVHHIDWAKNGQNVCIDNSKYVDGGVDDRSLTITSPTTEDAGQYTCTVTNAVGAASKSLTLDIPSTTISIEEPVCIGSEAKISSVVTACPPPEGATWQKSSDSVTFENINIDNPRYFGSQQKPSSPVLIITRATFDDKLYYRLLLWNKIGECLSNTVYLNVTGSPPNISNSQVTNIRNRSITLTCEIFLYENSPTVLEVFWMKNDEVLDIAGSRGKLEGGSVTNPSLIINNVNEFDAGSYQCKASNAAGSTLGNVIVLDIPDADVKESTTNDSKVFKADVRSIPMPIQVEWSVQNEDTDEWTSVDMNSEAYRGTTNSLPKPVLIVKKREWIKIHSFQLKVKNFIGTKIKLIPVKENGDNEDTCTSETERKHPMSKNNLVLYERETARENASTLQAQAEDDNKQQQQQRTRNNLLRFLLPTSGATSADDEHDFPVGYSQNVNQLMQSHAQQLKKNDVENKTGCDGSSPLWIACLNGQDCTVQLLLQKGADVNLCQNGGQSSLMVACKNEHESTVQILINKGADINLCENTGLSPLHIAASNGHYSLVQLLLSNGAKVNANGYMGESPLYHACSNGNINVVDLLMKYSADMNLCNNIGASPLHVACFNGHVSIAHILIKRGAEINLRLNDGSSPLWIACQEGYDKVVKFLLESGADVNLTNNKGGSPLYVACQQGRASTVQLLLNYKANVNLQERDRTTPLFIACQQGHAKVVQILLENGAAINLCKEDNTSPLYIACKNGHDNVVNLLLGKDAHVNLCTDRGTTALFVACQEGHTSIVQHLLNKGADINLCKKDGGSPLYIACQYGQDKIIQLLLDNGADINLCANNGFSPLYVACHYKHASTIQLLLNNGADVNFK